VPKINFFTPFQEEKEPSPLQSKPMIILFVILLAVVSYAALQGWVYYLEKDLAVKEQELNSVKTTQLDEVIQAKRKVNEQVNYQQLADRIQQEIKRKDFVKLQLIEKILETVPQNLYFQDFSLDRNQWRLLGFADSRQTIAKFEYNLKRSGLVDRIAIDNINTAIIENAGEMFIFNMDGTFSQGVVEHEN
jgi:Tfp pilus assembly protein PilN